MRGMVVAVVEILVLECRGTCTVDGAMFVPTGGTCGSTVLFNMAALSSIGCEIYGLLALLFCYGCGVDAGGILRSMYAERPNAQFVFGI